jgi:hypothetical protein
VAGIFKRRPEPFVQRRPNRVPILHIRLPLHRFEQIVGPSSEASLRRYIVAGFEQVPAGGA